MEQNKHDGWPDHIELFPRLDKICAFMGKIFARILHAPDNHSSHFVPFEDKSWTESEPTKF